MIAIHRIALTAVTGVLAIIILMALSISSSAAPVGEQQSQRPAGIQFIIDNDTHIDINSLDMIVTNHGSFAFNQSTGQAGLIYPRGSDRAVVFASGLWVGAVVEGGWHSPAPCRFYTRDTGSAGIVQGARSSSRAG